MLELRLYAKDLSDPDKMKGQPLDV